VKFSLKIPKRHRDEERGWPEYLFGGHVRTSTLVLIVAFLAVWWVYDTYRPHEEHGGPPATQVVPPGFVPDPNYTWVPRSQVQEPPSSYPVTTTTTTPTTTTTTPTTTTTTPPSPPPPFQLPCLPPFCTTSESPTTPPPQQRPPEPGPLPPSAPTPAPTSAPPAR